MTLEGLEVLLLQPDFATSPKIIGSHSSEKVDLSEAARVELYIGDHPLHSFTHRFKLTSRASIATLEDFFFDRAGKWQPFWLPSWHAELSPVATIANGGTTLSISPVNYASVYNPAHTNVARLGHYIFLLHLDGTFLIRKVTSVAGTSPEVLTLNSAVTREFKLGEFAVGFVYCVSAISDDLALTFNGSETATAELGVTEESFIDPATVTPETPTIPNRLVAKFNMDAPSGEPPHTVIFTDTSTGSPVSWLWNFGDGSATSTTQNPTHEFTNAGVYLVRLTVANSTGFTSTHVRTVAVTATPEPPEESLQANFTIDDDEGPAPHTAAFTDTSTGTPTGWFWFFGDGTTSGEQNPIHTYNNPGNYTVRLIVRDVNGAESTKTDNVLVTDTVQTVSACDSGAFWEIYPGHGTVSCASCCASLDGMLVGDLVTWSAIAIENCLGIGAVTGAFEYDGKYFGVGVNVPYNNGGSFNENGAYFYDVVRLS